MEKKLLLCKDNTIRIEIEKCVEILNKICKNVVFKSLPQNVDIGKGDDDLISNSKRESNLLFSKVKNAGYDKLVYLTTRRYKNNYYYDDEDAESVVTIVSFSNWDVYTNLPRENGLFYFITAILLEGFYDSEDLKMHYKRTGCVFDYLDDKSDIDYGMREGHICDDHQKGLTEAINKNYGLKNIYEDTQKLLNFLRNNSKWNRNVLSGGDTEELSTFDERLFIENVAKIYEKSGVVAKPNELIYNYIVDVYLEGKTKTVVECKFNLQAGMIAVSEFAKKVEILKRKGLIDDGEIVSYIGFTDEEKTIAETHKIRLLTFDELKKQYLEVEATVLGFKTVIEYRAKKPKSPDIFVIIPFIKSYDDVYEGIQKVAEELDLACEKADEKEFEGNVMDRVYQMIINAKIVIAVLTPLLEKCDKKLRVMCHNPNVYFELGYALAIKKQVIMLTNDIESSPFDVQQYKKIPYESVTEMKPKLREMLETIIREGYKKSRNQQESASY
ncbi:MAG: hypothetical protein HQK92_01170 [Nitrospirae bacterium]|nr:hypothetical protein [Nitrospirota bacterium]